MYKLPDKILKFKPYNVDGQKYSIKADANESFIEMPEDLRNKLANIAFNFDYNRYPDCFATKACAAFAKRYNLNCDNVTAGNGSDELISIIISAFLQKCDSILTLSPDFSMYSFYASLYENRCITLKKDENFNIFAEDIIKAANENGVKAVIFSNPCNPTGKGMKRSEIEKIIEMLPNTLIIIDEAYMEFYTESVIDKAEKSGNLIVLKTCSKALGMASLRLGFAVSNKDMTYALKTVKSPYNVNALTQAFSEVVIAEEEHINFAVEKIIKSRDMLYMLLKEIEEKYPLTLKVYPTNTNFVLIKTEDAAKIYEKLCEKGIAIRYIPDNFLRITAVEFEDNTIIATEIEKLL